MVMEVVPEEMQCINHPYKNSSPGGICALCLQEKLGKLVSSSFSAAVFPSSSSASPSPSFTSHFTNNTTTMQQPPHSHYPPPPSSSSSNNPNGGGGGPNYCSSYNTSHYHTRKPRLPFVITKNRKNKDGDGLEGSDPTTIVFKRSKSIATPKRRILDDETYGQHYSPHRRGFWSFLYTSKHSTPKKTTNNHLGSSSPPSLSIASREKKREDIIVMVDEYGSPDEASFDRKVSRSRSVGCGSRSFSGDLFDKISTGFGDCTLRRVESQREGGKPKVQPMNGQDCIKQRVSCGGIFSDFMVNSSSSSSSSSSLSSSYWVASTGEDSHVRHHHHHHLPNGRTKSWGWALASPMRAFGNKPAPATKRGKNTSPNLAAVPSLLAANA